MQGRSRSLLVLAVIPLAGALAFLVLRDEPRQVAETRTGGASQPNEVDRVEVATSARRAPVRPTPHASTTSSSPKRTASADASEEAEFMAMLRDVGLQDPELSLYLAREGEARFPGSPDGAERGWYAVRALVDLRRTDEAVAESRVLVEKYPNSSFSADVARHMLTHPMRDPGEVGYAQGP